MCGRAMLGQDQTIFVGNSSTYCHAWCSTIDIFHVTSCNDQAEYPDKLCFTGGKRVVGSTAILETRAVLELTYLVPKLLSIDFRVDKFRESA